MNPKTKKQKACFYCSKSHKKCENQRPCTNCIKTNKECYILDNVLQQKLTEKLIFFGMLPAKDEKKTESTEKIVSNKQNKRKSINQQYLGNKDSQITNKRKEIHKNEIQEQYYYNPNSDQSDQSKRCKQIEFNSSKNDPPLQNSAGIFFSNNFHPSFTNQSEINQKFITSNQSSSNIVKEQNLFNENFFPTSSGCLIKFDQNELYNNLLNNDIPPIFNNEMNLGTMFFIAEFVNDEKKLFSPDFLRIVEISQSLASKLGYSRIELHGKTIDFLFDKLKKEEMEAVSEVKEHSLQIKSKKKKKERKRIGKLNKNKK